MSHISEYADPFDVDRMLECMAQVNQRLLVTSAPGQSFSFSGGVHIVDSLSKLNHIAWLQTNLDVKKLFFGYISITKNSGEIQLKSI